MNCFRWLLVFQIFLFWLPSQGQENCKLKKDKDGIKVYTCDDADSKYKSLKAEFLLEGVTSDELKFFLLNGDNYINWQYEMIESKVLEQMNDHEKIIRTVVDAPWPVSNREMITHLKINSSLSGNLQIAVNTIKYDYPAKKDLVRVPFSDARWEVEKINERDLSIHYFLRIDPGGSIPTWLVNMAMAEGPYTSFRNLKKNLVKE